MKEVRACPTNAHAPDSPAVAACAPLQTLSVLVNSAPPSVSLSSLYHDLRALEVVADLHDLHVWSITNGQVSGSDALWVEPTPMTTLHRHTGRHDRAPGGHRPGGAGPPRSAGRVRAARHFALHDSGACARLQGDSAACPSITPHPPSRWRSSPGTARRSARRIRRAARSGTCRARRRRHAPTSRPCLRRRQGQVPHRAPRPTTATRTLTTRRTELAGAGRA